MLKALIWFRMKGISCCFNDLQNISVNVAFWPNSEVQSITIRATRTIC